MISADSISNFFIPRCKETRSKISRYHSPLYIYFFFDELSVYINREIFRNFVNVKYNPVSILQNLFLKKLRSSNKRKIENSYFFVEQREIGEINYTRINRKFGKLRIA